MLLEHLDVQDTHRQTATMPLGLLHLLHLGAEGPSGSHPTEPVDGVSHHCGTFGYGNELVFVTSLDHHSRLGSLGCLHDGRGKGCSCGNFSHVHIHRVTHVVLIQVGSIRLSMGVTHFRDFLSPISNIFLFQHFQQDQVSYQVSAGVFEGLPRNGISTSQS